MAEKFDLVCYLSNGYPTHEATLENARAYIKGGCDIIEIDLPNDNPFIDGPLLQERMKKSYSQDPTLKSHIETIYQIRKRHPDQRLIILAYEKTIVKIGVSEFVRIYHDNKIEGLILVDSHQPKLQQELNYHNIKIISYVTQDLEEKDLNQVRNNKGFIYLQAKNHEYSEEENKRLLMHNIKTLNDHFPDRDIYCGVGVSEQEDIRLLKEAGAQGAFVGSAVFTKENDRESMINFISHLKK